MEVGRIRCAVNEAEKKISVKLCVCYTDLKLEQVYYMSKFCFGLRRAAVSLFVRERGSTWWISPSFWKLENILCDGFCFFFYTNNIVNSLRLGSCFKNLTMGENGWAGREKRNSSERSYFAMLWLFHTHRCQIVKEDFRPIIKVFGSTQDKNSKFKGDSIRKRRWWHTIQMAWTVKEKAFDHDGWIKYLKWQWWWLLWLGEYYPDFNFF